MSHLTEVSRKGDEHAQESEGESHDLLSHTETLQPNNDNNDSSEAHSATPSHQLADPIPEMRPSPDALLAAEQHTTDQHEAHDDVMTLHLKSGSSPKNNTNRSNRPEFISPTVLPSSPPREDMAEASSSVIRADEASDTKRALQLTADPSSSASPRLSLDLHVGTWRDLWPRDITAIVNVDRNTVVRYFRALKKVDLVKIVPTLSSNTLGEANNNNNNNNKGQTPPLSPAGGVPPAAAASTQQITYDVRVLDSFWISSLPNIATVHHFTVDRALIPKQQQQQVSSGGLTHSSSQSGFPTQTGATPADDTASSATSAGKANCLLCIADDLKRCIVFSIQGDKLQQLNVSSLPMKVSHIVPFAYRGIHYFLAYFKGSGEYGIIPFSSLTFGSQPQFVARGQFRPGWTDILWKGTHHVRCTRQKFFCYNNVSGETVFECVWVRGASGSSSVCSNEHTTMTVDGGKRHGGDSKDTEASAGTDPELDTALQRKACLVVPLTIGGTFAAMLYSHSAFTNTRRGSQMLQRGQSSGRLVDTSSGGGAGARDRAALAMRSLTLYNVAEAASLMLRKRVFAHAEPWTHFSMLTDFIDGDFFEDGGAAGSSPTAGFFGQLGTATMLSYSEVSGEVWINTMYFTEVANVSRDVTIYEAPMPAVVVALPNKGRGGHADHASSTGGTEGSGLHRHMLHGNRHSGGGGGGGVDVNGFLSEQVNRRSPFDHPLTHDDENQPHRGGGGSRHPMGGLRPPISGSNAHQRSSLSLHHGSIGHDEHGDRIDDSPHGSYLNRNTPIGRPSSCSISLNHRLRTLPPSTGDYHEDIARVIRHISITDFCEGAPYPRLALSQVPKLPPSDPRLASLEAGPSPSPAGGQRDGSTTPSRNSPRGGAAGGSHGGSEGLVLPPASPRFKAPWRPSSAPDVAIPAPPQSCVAKFEREYEKHICTEIPKRLANNEELTKRLYRPGVNTREQYQQEELDRLYKWLATKQVSHACSPTEVAKTVEKLGVLDVVQRKKKEDERQAQRTARPPTVLHDNITLTPNHEHLVGMRLHDFSLETRQKHLDALRAKLYQQYEVCYGGSEHPLGSPRRNRTETPPKKEQQKHANSARSQSGSSNSAKKTAATEAVAVRSQR